MMSLVTLACPEAPALSVLVPQGWPLLALKPPAEAPPPPSPSHKQFQHVFMKLMTVNQESIR